MLNHTSLMLASYPNRRHIRVSMIGTRNRASVLNDTEFVKNQKSWLDVVSPSNVDNLRALLECASEDHPVTVLFLVGRKRRAGFAQVG